MSAALTRVSMNLTERDIKNTESVRHLFNVDTNADAVSAALGITRSLGEMVKNGGEIFIRNKKGELQRIIVPGLDNDK